MARWQLTVRHGPRVERASFDDLDEAIAAMREGAASVRGEGDLPPAQGFREYEPNELVHARLELSSGGMLRGHEAGIDVMGNGALVPYRGVIRKRRLEPRSGEDAFDVVREALL